MKREPQIGPKQVGAFLEDRVRRLGDSAPIFYNDLASQLSLPPVTDAWFAHPLCKIFGELDSQEARLGRPFRTALVISRERNMPGEGFFKAYLEFHPSISRPKAEHDKMRLYL